MGMFSWVDKAAKKLLGINKEEKAANQYAAGVEQANQRATVFNEAQALASVRANADAQALAVQQEATAKYVADLQAQNVVAGPDVRLTATPDPLAVKRRRAKFGTDYDSGQGL